MVRMTDDTLVLYRFFDKDGRLLYVGRSVGYGSRIVDHSHRSGFYPRATTITLQRGFANAGEWKKAEKRAIATENPEFNVAGRVLEPGTSVPINGVQAAALAQVHPNTIRNWADRGLLTPTVLPSGVRRYDSEQIRQVSSSEGGADFLQGLGVDPA